MGRDESGTLAALKAHRRELIDPKIAEYDGRIVKTTGDGLLLEFASVVDAVRCAVDVQRRMAERNASVPAERQLQFRIGINVGDIIIDDDDIFGDGVNVAARLQTLAEPGGIFASRVVRDHVLDKLSFTFEDIGAQTVKNIARPVEVYRIRDDLTDGAVVHPQQEPVVGPPAGRQGKSTTFRWWAAGAFAFGLAGAVAWSVPQVWRTAPPSGPPSLSIAILPLAVPDGGPAESQFADTLTQDVTTALGQWRSATLASQGSASKYKDKAIDARSVGRELNVRYLAAGEVRHAGTKIVVTVHLIDTVSGANTWSERLEFNAVPPGGEHSVAATRLYWRLRNALYGAEMRRAAAHPIAGSAWDLVLRGYGAISDRSDYVGAAHKARRLFDDALRIDPSFVPALVALAGNLDFQMTNNLDLNRSRFAQLLDELDKVTSRAVSIDQNHADAWDMRALSLCWLGRWDEALAANAKAQALDPSNADFVANHSYMELASGRPELALSLAERAIAMDRGRMSEEGGAIRMVCQSNLMLGRYDLAVQACERSAALQNWWVDHAWLVAGYAQQGNMTKATLVKAALLKQQPGFNIDRFKASDAAATSPAYLPGAENHLYSGLRKVGLAER